MKIKNNTFLATLLIASLILPIIPTKTFANSEPNKDGYYAYEYTGERYNNGTRDMNSIHKLHFRWMSGNYPLEGYRYPDGWRPYDVSTGMFNLKLDTNDTNVAAYCCDFLYSAVEGYKYSLVNLEDSTYLSDKMASYIRGALKKGYKPTWTDEDLKRTEENVNEWLNTWDGTYENNLLPNDVKKPVDKVSNLTVDEAITATQLAIWAIANTDNMYMEFRLSLPNPDGTNNAYGEPLTNNIKAFRNYLLSQKSEELNEQNIIFSAEYLSNAEWSNTGEFDDKYTVYGNFKLNGDIEPDDELKLKVSLGDTIYEYDLNGENALIPNNEGYYRVGPFKNVKEAELLNGIKLELYGHQYVNGCYFFQPEGSGNKYSIREDTQNMVSEVTLLSPVYATKTIPIEVGTKSLSLYTYDITTPVKQGENTILVDNQYYKVLPETYVDVYMEYTTEKPMRFILRSTRNMNTNRIKILENVPSDKNGYLRIDGLQEKIVDSENNIHNLNYFVQNVKAPSGYEIANNNVMNATLWDSTSNEITTNLPNKRLIQSDEYSYGDSFVDDEGNDGKYNVSIKDPDGDYSFIGENFDYLESSLKQVVEAGNIESKKTASFKNEEDIKDGIVNIFFNIYGEKVETENMGSISTDSNATDSNAGRILNNEVLPDGILTDVLSEHFSFIIDDKHPVTVNGYKYTSEEDLENGENINIDNKTIVYDFGEADGLITIDFFVKLNNEYKTNDQDASFKTNENANIKYNEIENDGSVGEEKEIIMDSPTVNLKIEKFEKVTAEIVWKNDNESERPDNIIIKLYKDNNLYDEIELKKDNNYYFEWPNLEYGSDYEIVWPLVDGYNQMESENGNNFVLEAEPYIGIDIIGKIEWINDNSDERPDKVIVNLYEDGNLIDSKELTPNNWEYIWENMNPDKEYDVVFPDLDSYTETKTEKNNKFVLIASQEKKDNENNNEDKDENDNVTNGDENKNNKPINGGYSGGNNGKYNENNNENNRDDKAGEETNQNKDVYINNIENNYGPGFENQISDNSQKTETDVTIIENNTEESKQNDLNNKNKHPLLYLDENPNLEKEEFINLFKKKYNVEVLGEMYERYNDPTSTLDVLGLMEEFEERMLPRTGDIDLNFMFILSLILLLASACYDFKKR